MTLANGEVHETEFPDCPGGPGGDRPMSNDEDVLIVVNQKDVAQQ